MTTQHCTQCGAVLEPQARFCRDCGAQVQSAKMKKRPHRRSNHYSPSIPSLLLVVGGLLMLVWALFSFLSQPAPVAAPSANVASIPDQHDESGLPYPEVARISLGQAKANLEMGTAVMVDVRSREEYIEAHIPDAISMPLAELGTGSQELAKDVEIITYCA